MPALCHSAEYLLYVIPTNACKYYHSAEMVLCHSAECYGLYHSDEYLAYVILAECLFYVILLDSCFVILTDVYFISF